jgi:type II secretory pathway predicted ATPase ExeA
VVVFDHADRLRPGALSLLEQLLHSVHARGIILLFAARSEGRTPLLKMLSEHTGLRVELPALSVEESQWYVEYLNERGLASSPDFTRDATQRIARITEGVPRQINRLGRAVLLAAKADQIREINAELVLSIAEELLDMQATES